MPPRLTLCVVVLLAAAACGPGAPVDTWAQSPALGPRPSVPDSALLGVVWTPPRTAGEATQDLTQIDAAGATAVRLTGRLPPERIFSHADTLGLGLFVDLPVTYVSAATLDDSLRAARPQLTRLQRLAERHSSLRAVGLAQGANTTRLQACTALRTWTERVHANAPDLRTYYVTPFTASADRCLDAVDRVLIDSRGHPRPSRRLRAWRQVAPAPGMGALGTWVRPAAGSGLQVPHSPQRQARYFEAELRTLLLSERGPPPIFTYRWRDPETPSLPSRRFGLRTSNGTPRPAARVVEGFYRGTQRVFAFSRGTAPSRTPLFPILLAWGIVGLLGGLYARNPYVRRTLIRYFAAPGFYRDAVQEGRDVGATENALLLGIVGAALGIIGSLAARVAAEHVATGRVVEALPAPLEGLLAAGVSQPTAAGLVVGGVATGLLLSWGLLLVLVARLERSFTVAQGLMLVTWPCWPAVFGVVIALMAATNPPIPTGLLGLALSVGTLGTVVAVTGRVLWDFWRVSGVERPWVAVLVLPSPLMVFGVILTIVTLEYDLPLRLLWHLLTRT